MQHHLFILLKIKTHTTKTLSKFLHPIPLDVIYAEPCQKNKNLRTCYAEDAQRQILKSASPSTTQRRSFSVRSADIPASFAPTIPPYIIRPHALPLSECLIGTVLMVGNLYRGAEIIIT